MAGMKPVQPGTMGRGLTPLAPPDQPPMKEQNWLPSWGAYGRMEPGLLLSAFGYDNDVVAALDLMNRPAYEPEAGFTPLSVIKGTRYEELYLDNFVGAVSEQETRDIIARIDREEIYRRNLAAGGFRGTVASMAAGVTSPVSLIPIGGWAARLGKGGSTLVRSAEGAVVVGASVAAQEGALQAAQETRSAAESAFAIAIGTAVGGVLGPFVSRADIDALTTKAMDYPGTLAEETAMWQKAVSAGAAATADARGSGELAGALGAERAFSFQDPLIRLQTSPFESARNTIRDLAETPLTLAENSDGIATTIGGSVETRIKMARAPLASTLSDMDSLYSRYFFGEQKRFAPARGTAQVMMGRGGGKLSYSDFKAAVGEAMWSGDVHAIPEVAEAARSMRARVFDPLKKEAIEVGLFDESVNVADDPSYLHRMYLDEVIRARRGEFTGILARHFEARQADILEEIAELERRTGAENVDPKAIKPKMDELSSDEIKALADEITDTILGNAPSRVLTPADLVQGPRGPLKERVLRIPTALISDFVEKDVEVVARRYAETMAADIGLMRKYGSTTLEEQIAKINDEANAKIAQTTTEKARKALDAQRQAAVRDLAAVRDRIRGTYALPNNPDGLLVRAGRVARNLNYLRLLGGMTLSAVPDMAKPVMTYGLTRTMRTAFLPLVRGSKTFKLAAKEAKLAGTALDMTLDSRAMAIADVMDDYGRGSKFERALSTGTRSFGVVSLMAPWNAAMKQFVGVIAQTKILQGVERVVAGKASKKEIEYLAANGIDATMADRIWRQFAGDPPAQIKRLPASGSLSSPPPPTADDMAKFSRVESVPLSAARGTQAKMQWERFNSGDFPPPLIDGYGDKPVAVLREDGEYLIFDGHHRTVMAVNRGDDAMDMYVIRAKQYAPEAAGRKPAPSAWTDSDDDLLRELEGISPTPPPTPAKPARAVGHGVRDGDVWWANTEAWTDRQAVESMRAALVRDVDRVIVTPGQDKPLWMSTELGKLVGQFKSFGVSSVQRTMISGLQQRDMAAFNGMMMMLGLGAVSYYLKMEAGGFEVSDDPVKWATEAFDRSGLAGWIGDANNVVEKLTRGRVGLSAFTGEQATRYASRNALGALLGPTFDTVGDAIQITSSAFAGDWTASDTRAFRKLVPMQNLFYLRQLFDKVEAGANQTFGIPQRSGQASSARSMIR